MEQQFHKLFMYYPNSVLSFNNLWWKHRAHRPNALYKSIKIIIVKTWVLNFTYAKSCLSESRYSCFAVYFYFFVALYYFRLPGKTSAKYFSARP